MSGAKQNCNDVHSSETAKPAEKLKSITIPLRVD